MILTSKALEMTNEVSKYLTPLIDSSINEPITAPIVSNIILQTAENIFDNITSSDVKARVSKEDIVYTVKQLEGVINADEALHYLTINDGVFLQQITLAIESGMREVFSHDQISLSDLPAICRMVKQVAQSINHMHTKSAAIVTISTHTLLPMLEILILLVAQMIVPPAEFASVKLILSTAFDLLSTNIQPIMKRPCCVWLQHLKCLFPMSDHPVAI